MKNIIDKKIFLGHLDKMVTKDLHFHLGDSYQNSACCDRVNGKIVIGGDEKTQRGYFKYLQSLLLIEQVITFTVRIYTNQFFNDLEIKELYCFGIFLNENMQVDYELFDATTVENAHNIDYQTQKAVAPEPNVIYSDLDGNKICSWDITE